MQATHPHIFFLQLATSCRSMRSQIANRLRSNSIPLPSVPPPQTSKEYSITLAKIAAQILYRSPLPSQNDLPVFILNAAAFPDARNRDYDALLPYVLSRLPDDEELIGGHGYEVVFFAGGGGGNEAMQTKKARPGWGWFLQAYHVLNRATRKRLQKLYLVHEKNWIRVLVEMFATVVSPKFRKKIVHGEAPYMNRKRLPRVLREATSFVLMDNNIKTSGIFRINARAQTVEILREAYDRGQKFIVWKEINTVLASSHRRERTGEVWVDELDQTEGYELQAAAALIKLWYKELVEPIFPTSCYQALEKYYGNPDISLEPSQLLAMLSMDDEWSLITNKTSKHILIMHLLPLLSRVSEFSDWNQMTPDNLGVCFAPSLLHGPDPIEDLKLSTIIRRILVAMIMHWKILEPVLNTSFEKFEESLRMPEAIEDREDPLEEAQTKQSSDLDTQVSGITLMDNEDGDEDEEGSPPPLPPRPRAATVHESLFNATSRFDFSLERGPSPANADAAQRTGSVDEAVSNGISPVRRKPAPALLPLPRYSTIVNDRPAAFQSIQYYNTVPVEEEEYGEVDYENRLPMYHEGVSMYKEPARAAPSPPPGAEQSIQRKPLPKTASGV
ncbi:hypothetical protein OEA41_003253 [Lepraria neglecta]|uniref:Rho-GAP domain-containing protein n=1 Tax=Lepraria neglecta TaxID=209136 RepID=A0AAD9Z479_9LECA|nr:hypothetical protein OEA41_003253 [Lepraria neglecta]